MTLLADYLENLISQSYGREPVIAPEDSEEVRELEHQLRTPWTIIAGYLQLLHDGDVSLHVALPPMRDAAKELEKLISDYFERDE